MSVKLRRMGWPDACRMRERDEKFTHNCDLKNLRAFSGSKCTCEKVINMPFETGCEGVKWIYLIFLLKLQLTVGFHRM